MKFVQIILLAVASLLFTSCKTEIEIKLFSSDLFEAENHTELDAKLFFEIPSAEWLKEDGNKIKLTKFLTQHFGKLGDFSTQSVELTTFCVVPFKTALSSKSNPSEIFALSRASNDSGIQIFCEINKDKFNNFKESANDKFMSSIKLEDIKLRFMVYNDNKSEIEVTGYSVYMGNTPAAFESTVKLQRREELAVLVSAIHLAAIHNNGKSRILTLKK